MTETVRAAQQPPAEPAEHGPHARRWGRFGVGFLVKLALMGVVNAFGVSVLLSAWQVAEWGVFWGSLVILVAVDWIYFSKRALPLKYLAPGLVFLAVFQVFTMAYTGYVAFTNYGTGHNGSMSQAVDALLIQNERRLEDSPSYPLAVVQRGDDLGFAINDDGTIRVGSSDAPLRDAAGSLDGSGKVTAVDGWDVVPRNALLSDTELQQQVVDLRVPVSRDAREGSIRTREGSTGAIYRSVLVWDEDAETLTNVDTGVVYEANDRGMFEAPDGETLRTGWYVPVGFENFIKAVADPNYSVPLLRVTVWTFVFAALSVAVPFIVGLLLAIAYNDIRVRGRRLIRTLFILPYAFPAFLSALLWRGMLNPEYGIVNDWFFFDSYIGWLTDPWLAKFSILFVNLWLSYPYWFLIGSGALQAIPSEMTEAARIDGAAGGRMFRSITMPLVLVSTAPLLIASFAFSFNNFVIIYMLTGGGPAFSDSSTRLGHTDILISAVYRLSGVAGGVADYGLASALAIIIFIVVGTISALAFRMTRKLEEVY